MWWPLIHNTCHVLITLISRVTSCLTWALRVWSSMRGRVAVKSWPHRPIRGFSVQSSSLQTPAFLRQELLKGHLRCFFFYLLWFYSFTVCSPHLFGSLRQISEQGNVLLLCKWILKFPILWPQMERFLWAALCVWCHWMHVHRYSLEFAEGQNFKLPLVTSY